MSQEDSKLGRKCSKLAMEKRRRIKQNLPELKIFIFEALNRNLSRYSKLEKVHILEMTEQLRRRIRTQRKAVAIVRNPNVLSNYRSGYKECLEEVTRYMNSQHSIDEHVKVQILSHLVSNCRTTSLQDTNLGYFSSAAIDRIMNGGRTGPLSGYLRQVPQSLVPVGRTNFVPAAKKDTNLAPHFNEATVVTEPLWRPCIETSDI